MGVRAHVVTALIFLSFLSTRPSFAQGAQHVVISGVAPMGGSSSQFDTGEFIELYNPLPSDVTFGSGVQIISGNTSGTNAAEWQLSLSGKTIKAFGYFLIGDAGVKVTCDASFPSKKNLANSGGRSCVQLRDGSTVIDAFAWDPAATLLLAPEGTPFTPSGTTSAGRSFERKSGSAAVADDNLGNAWDTNDNSADFFENTAANTVIHNSSSAVEVNPYNVLGSGIGTGRISPTVISAGESGSFTINLTGNATDTIRTIVVIVPAAFSWPMNKASVSLSGDGASAAEVAVSGDTVSVSGASVTATDSVQIGLSSLTAPDSVVRLNFVLKTAIANVVPTPVQSQLYVSVLKLAPIATVHVNDSNGVPAEPYQVGAPVKVTGIVTADLDPSRTDFCVQDATAGIEVYASTRYTDYAVGDSVTVTGTISQYAGLTEISPASDGIVVHAHNKNVPPPALVTTADMNETFDTEDFTERNEGRLIRINHVTFTPAGTTGGTITDITGNATVYSKNTYVYPTGTFDLIGIVKQHKTSSPYTGGYEIDPRSQSDIVLSSGPAFGTLPVETNIARNSVTIHFTTATPSQAVVKYGATSDYRDSVVVSTPDTSHDVVLSGLWPATVYHYQVGVRDGSGTNYSGDAVFSTASPESSSDSIDVYFNHSADNSVSLGENAVTTNISQKFIARINAARYSIDVALYSLSGNVGSSIASALINAKNRGVRIRMIVENDNSSTSPMTTMKTSVPFITDTFDPVNAGAGLMHNKFAVFDFRDTSSAADDWVWSGSWNATDPGTNDDAQNAIEIQDKSLANAYTMEFNEMWGSDTDTPNASLSRFGARKTDNTPHRFVIAGYPIELYFSPSDRTTMHIESELSSAAFSVNVAMLTFTRDDLAQVLISKKAAGKKVRVILDNNTDSGNEFLSLQSGGVDVRLKGSAVTGLLHHKYAVIDGEMKSGDQAVITGSHNWSRSAENSNNENTLIIHSKRIANLYLQEFKSRYLEAGGSDDIELGAKRIGEAVPTSFGLDQNYPNPFNPATAISYRLSASSFVGLKVYDILGREIATLVNEKQPAGYYRVTFDASRFASGTYFYILRAGGNTIVRKMMLVK